MKLFRRRAALSQSEQVKSDAKRKLLKIRREGEKSASTAHRYSSVGIVVIAAMALFGLSHEDIVKLLNTPPGQHINIGQLVPLAVIFVSIVVMNVGQLVAARSKRRSESRGEAVKSIDKQIMYGVLGAESLSFGYALWLIDQPHTIIQWLLLIIRSALFTYTVMYLEIQREQPIDTVDMITQAEIGQGYGMLDELVERAYDTDLPLALRMQSYQATATLEPQMERKLQAMVAASQAQDTYRKDKTIVLVNTKGAPLVTISKQNETAQPAPATAPVQTAEKTPAQRVKRGMFGKEQKTKTPSKKLLSDEEKQQIMNLLRDDATMSGRAIARMIKRSEATVAYYIKEANATIKAERKSAAPVGSASRQPPPSVSVVLD